MKRISHIVCMLLVMTTLLSLPAAASSSDGTDDNSLSSLFNSYVQEKRLNSNNISVAYYNTVSGEEFLWNSDDYYVSASIYKLPLNMYYYEQEAAGLISSSKKFAGYPLSTCHKLSLQYSENKTSQAMRSALGTVKQYKTLMAKYGGVPEDSLPDTYYSTTKYSSGFILNTLKYLYDNQDFFSEAIQYLKDAHPRQWFERYLPDSECTVAQKYGWIQSDKAYAHTAGIIYADEPFLLVVFTKGLPYSERVIGDVARICYDYTQANAGRRGERVLHFEDVFTTDWYADAVAYCTRSGIVVGTSDTTFTPDRTCTNVEIITALWRGVGKPAAADAAPVTVDSCFQDAVNWAYGNGVIDASFLPDAPCTRAGAVVYMWEAAGCPDAEADTNFSDVPADCSQAVSWAESKGIVKGTGANTFSPDKACSRAEIITLIYRAVNSCVFTEQQEEGDGLINC